ncbi:MAG: efflux RND transporter periplasmic adaptor subunit [Gammaproteobacteria bacterium]|nr:efflux RND transporter periplasmic adaptor subunit [Gammaproteobacteria bacterium]
MTGLAAEPPAKGAAPATGAPPPRPMSVEVMQAVVTPVNDEATAVGSLQSNEAVVIRSELAGRIAAIKFQEGKTAAAGDLLFSLDASEYQAQLAQSSASMKLMEMNFNRAKDLREKSLISQQEYDDTSAKLEEARAKLAVDQSRLEKTSIRAPFNGVLGVRSVSPGAYIKPGEDLVMLEDIDPIKVEFRIPETYSHLVKPGQHIAVRVDAYPGELFNGEVYVIDTRMDSQTRTMLLRGRIPNSKRNLRPGMFARVALILATRSNALVVPEQAIVPFGSDQFVYRVIDGKAVQTRVETGRRLDGKVEIKSGVNAGDTVITAGQMKIRDGMPVAVLDNKAATPAAAAQAGSKP